ncbi:Crp/Fnr family transcriptional regulator [Algoriphagus halophytocola]|uniref:Crp/Fnr family transcriptional regulator n=1 Tax=Algoriphagus halophytocola TaxID=2991499 RepID=A0ABY6MGX2_9BACT|nr:MULTISPECIES: Crp/Fnr family transcriptional regulator [unclassified Algoriphagus]UZD22714.1 Crp/Fnr family transcriptional regulator [Algoriphagus sp. TR-M5]WBL43979.1 Crp/Fnr family transcriptional regulator [Algoriphagus sp. TR-M9]
MSKIPSNHPCDLCSSRKLSMLADLTEEQACNISDNKNMISHRKGQMLYYEKAKPLGVFCVNSGVIKIFKTASNGKEQIIHLAKKGDLLGYSALLGEENYTNSAMVIENAKICFIPKETFLKALVSNGPFFKRLTKALSHEIGVMEEKLVDASQKSIRERLAYLLLQLANSYGLDGGDHQQIDLVLSREEIASLIGTATESVIRLLSEFKKDKLIELKGKKIVILDKKGLVKLSDFYA